MLFLCPMTIHLIGDWTSYSLRFPFWGLVATGCHSLLSPQQCLQGWCASRSRDQACFLCSGFKQTDQKRLNIILVERCYFFLKIHLLQTRVFQMRGEREREREVRAHCGTRSSRDGTSNLRQACCSSPAQVPLPLLLSKVTNYCTAKEASTTNSLTGKQKQRCEALQDQPTLDITLNPRTTNKPCWEESLIRKGFLSKGRIQILQSQLKKYF